MYANHLTGFPYMLRLRFPASCQPVHRKSTGCSRIPHGMKECPDLRTAGSRCVLMRDERRAADILGFALEVRLMWLRVSCILRNERRGVRILSANTS